MRYATLSIEQLTPWAALNDVRVQGIELCENIVGDDGISKGGGILATQKLEHDEVLLSIPSDLILSKENVFQYAKMDKHFRELLDAMHDFGQVRELQVSFTCTY